MGNGRIDWAAIQRRIAAADRAMAEASAPGPDEQRRILKRRAEMLARERDAEPAADTLEIVEFRLADEHYGIESRFIGEVRPVRDITPLPGVPDFVLGLVNIRGRILSVIDMKKFFDMPGQGISDLNTIIVIADERMSFGILADAICGVRHIAHDAVAPPLPTLTGIRAEYLRGVTAQRLVLLDAARLLADTAIIVHEEV